MRSFRSVTAVAAVLVLGACTSGDPDNDPATSSAATQDAAQTSGPSGPSANGWLCEDMSPANLRAVAGGELAEPREVMVADDDTSWVCEAYDGQTPLLRLSVVVGEEGREEARALAADAEGAAPGPDYLGESVVGPRRGVSITLCTDPGAEDDARTPYSITAEALGDSPEDVSEALRSTLTLTAGKLDQGFGCSPKAALEDAEQATGAP